MNFPLNTSDQQPIYRQIVKYVEEEIAKGRLLPGTKLPTFRSLSETLNVSLGTVKRAYDELERNGSITMTQGRGSFVKIPESLPNNSKKDNAMGIIDSAIKQMLNLSLSTQEIRIFFDLKLRKLEGENQYVKVAIIDCSIEALIMIESKISVLNNVDISLFLLSDIENNPGILPKDADLFVTTFTHFNDVSQILHNPDKLMGIVMSTSLETAVQLSKIEPHEKLGILTASKVFARVMNRSYNQFFHKDDVIPAYYFRDEGHLEEFIKSYNKLIVPTVFRRLVSPKELEAIENAKNAGKEFISFEYETDEGSFVYLKDRITELGNKKNYGG